MVPTNPWAFTSTSKVDGGRSAPFEETLARVRAVASGLPVTRVVDLTALDFLRLPAYSAVTPLARDLKVHLGKGASRVAARVAALMEAVERVSAEDVSPDVVSAPYEELATASAVDPREFDLPHDTEYRPDLPLDWVMGRDLIQGQDVLIPVDLTITPPRQGVLQDVDTNGLASGNNLLEAVTHAICEVVERDALSQIQFAASFGEPHDQPTSGGPIDLTTLPPRSREWVERIVAADMDLDILDITTDIGVPTFQALLVDEHYPASDRLSRPAGFFGLGTHPDPEVAVFRALSEAIQARAGMIHAARDSYNDDGTLPRPAADVIMRGRTQYRRRRPLSDTPSFRSTDLLAELDFLVNRLASAGARHCIVVDVTRQEWGIPVVRVRIPGLSQYCVNKRRPGPRCLRYLL